MTAPRTNASPPRPAGPSGLAPDAGFPSGPQRLRVVLRLALSVAIAAALTAAVLAWSGVSPRECLQALARLTLGTWLLAFGLHVALYLLRAVRFATLMPPVHRPRAWPFLSVCAAHTLAAFVLPAKLGEATFVLYAQRATGVPPAVGLASLVVSRLLDTAVLAAGMGLSCFALQASGAFPALGWLIPLGSGLTLLAALVFVLSARSDLLTRGASALVRVLGLARTALGERSAARIDVLSRALRESGREGRLLRAALVSVPIWLVIFLFCAVLARGLGLPAETTLAQATFGSSLAILTSLIPVSAFANLGTLEIGWVLGFGLLGVPRDLALATGFGLHAVQLVHVVALGLLGHAGMACCRRPAARVLS